MKKFNTLSEFKASVYEPWQNLSSIEEYLNEAGIAKKRALRDIYHLTCFAEDFETLSELCDEMCVNEDDHPEYLRNVRMLIKVIKNSAED